MPTKLKDLKVTKVDFVDAGANPGANILLFKHKEGADAAAKSEVVVSKMEIATEKHESALKRLFGKIAKTDGIAAGEDVTIQVKDIGLWKTGAAVKAGAELMADASGKAITATTGKFILAFALEEATAADQVIRVQVCKAGYKA